MHFRLWQSKFTAGETNCLVEEGEEWLSVPSAGKIRPSCWFHKTPIVIHCHHVAILERHAMRSPHLQIVDVPETSVLTLHAFMHVTDLMQTACETWDLHQESAALVVAGPHKSRASTYTWGYVKTCKSIITVCCCGKICMMTVLNTASRHWFKILFKQTLEGGRVFRYCISHSGH